MQCVLRWQKHNIVAQHSRDHAVKQTTCVKSLHSMLPLQLVVAVYTCLLWPDQRWPGSASAFVHCSQGAAATHMRFATISMEGRSSDMQKKACALALKFLDKPAVHQAAQPHVSSHMYARKPPVYCTHAILYHSACSAHCRCFCRACIAYGAAGRVGPCRNTQHFNQCLLEPQISLNHWQGCSS